ncbi:hypothetical protein [Spirosoma agri]|uniref:Uncharacterized protein n=1 Tax=Spirosoma agri TaxID=1987381 RepID=A0A6M0II79_9BACT|nr:hypothetical protein [Spirosoma agri]NEU67970.1 hypothetical protein [Spirosoma agri]
MLAKSRQFTREVAELVDAMMELRDLVLTYWRSIVLFWMTTKPLIRF